jgi:hypothetical protein
MDDDEPDNFADPDPDTTLHAVHERHGIPDTRPEWMW